MTRSIVIVGAGLTGCTIARVLADNGYNVTVYERSNCCGGMTTDELVQGYLKGRYGAHVFHTSNKEVWDFITQFCEMLPYRHQAKVLVDDTILPFPPNRQTLSHFKTTENLFNTVFKPYTEKMWGTKLENISEDVIKRIPIKDSDDEFYFNDTYQGIPKHGYTNLCMSILNHHNIKVLYNSDFTFEDQTDKIVYTGSIDTFFNYKLGVLPYRSINFTTKFIDTEILQAQTNYAPVTRYTRVYSWGCFPYNSRMRKNFVTYEEPCEATLENRFYPIDNKDTQKLFQAYQKLSDSLPNVHFVGRMGQYKYLDMDKAVFNALKFVKTFLRGLT